MRGKEFRAREKKVQKLTREGLVEKSLATGKERRVSQRTTDIAFRSERSERPQEPSAKPIAENQRKPARSALYSQYKREIMQAAAQTRPLDLEQEQPEQLDSLDRLLSTDDINNDGQKRQINTDSDVEISEISELNTSVMRDTRPDAPRSVSKTSPKRRLRAQSDKTGSRLPAPIAEQPRQLRQQDIVSESPKIEDKPAGRLRFQDKETSRATFRTKTRQQRTAKHVASTEQPPLATTAKRHELPPKEQLTFEHTLTKNVLAQSKLKPKTRKRQPTKVTLDTAKVKNNQRAEPETRPTLQEASITKVSSVESKTPAAKEVITEVASLKSVKQKGLATKERLIFERTPPTSDQPTIKKRRLTKATDREFSEAILREQEVSAETFSVRDQTLLSQKREIDTGVPSVEEQPLTQSETALKLSKQPKLSTKKRLKFEPIRHTETPPSGQKQPVQQPAAKTVSSLVQTESGKRLEPIPSKQEAIIKTFPVKSQSSTQSTAIPPNTKQPKLLTKERLKFEPVRHTETQSAGKKQPIKRLTAKPVSSSVQTENGKSLAPISQNQEAVEKSVSVKSIPSTQDTRTTQSPKQQKLSTKQHLKFEHTPPVIDDRELKQKPQKRQPIQPTSTVDIDTDIGIDKIEGKSSGSGSSESNLLPKGRLYWEDIPTTDSQFSAPEYQPAESDVGKSVQPKEPQKPRHGRLHFEDVPASAKPPPKQQTSPITDTKQPKQQHLCFEDTPKVRDVSGNGLSPRQKRRYAKAEKRVEQASHKLEKAQSKIPTKRRVRLQKQYDSKSGRVKHQLRFEKEEIAENTPLSLPKRAGNALVQVAGATAVMQVHQQFREIERENTAVEATHTSELTTQGIWRLNQRRRRTKPYREVRQAKRRLSQKQANLEWQTFLRDNPEMRRKNAMQKAMQKRKIKRKYAQAAREAEKTVQYTQRVANTVGQIVRATTQMVTARKSILLVVTLLALIVVMFSAGFVSCTAMLSGIQSSYISASYMANEDDITDADLYYTKMETDLQIDINETETNYPGYAGYSYTIREISHNPYELMGYLSTAFNAFTFSDVKNELERIFGLQYTLEREVVEENVLQTTLTVKPLSEIILENLSAGEQTDRYEIYMKTYGNRQAFYNPFDFPWLGYVSSRFGWRIHPINGDKRMHEGVDIAVAEGTPIHAIHDGRVIFAGENGGYGLCIKIKDDKGYQSNYAHCSSLSVHAGQEVESGDVIAVVGNTGDSTGAHLHLETLLNGEYLNPCYFVETGGRGAAPGMPGVPGAAGEPMGDGTFAAMLTEAERYLGYPYVWGGSSPSTSFDCSGFVCWVINQSGVGSVGRTTAQGLYNMCTPVSRSDAQPGDLIFFTGTYSTSDPVTHIGIYVGNGRMIHCGNPISYADINNSYWSSHFYGFGRI